MNLNLIGQALAIFPIIQTECQVIVRHIGKERLVQQTDTERRPQLVVTVALRELLPVEARPIVQNTATEVSRQQELYLNIEQLSLLIPSFDVQNTQLVLAEILVVERVEDLHVNDRLGPFEDRIEQVGQDIGVSLVAEDPFKGVVNFRIDAQNHGRWLPPKCPDTPLS